MSGVKDNLEAAVQSQAGARVMWDPNAQGVLRLPSGRLIRGRGLVRGTWNRPMPSEPLPEFALYCLGDEPPEVQWESRWLRWRDFWLPHDPAAFAEAVREAWVRAETERVEVACAAGKGRTGTTLACIAVLDGVPAREAVRYVRANYHPGAVETRWQRRYVRGFPPEDPIGAM